MYVEIMLPIMDQQMFLNVQVMTFAYSFNIIAIQW